MMNPTLRATGRYAERFADLKAEGRKAFIPFTLLGWPTPERSLETVRCMLDAGVSALELGFPFSDPVADGPVIQMAGHEALENGFTVDTGFELLHAIRALDATIPIGLLMYYNLILARGVEKFFQDAAAAGVDAVLIADLPPESAEEVAPAAQAAGIDLIFIVSPLTRDERLDRINTLGGGFLYVVSRLGITGVESRTDADLGDLLTRLKAHSALPACVGFGVSTPEQARDMLALGADGIITGSRVVQLVREAGEAPLQNTLAPFFEAMLAATASV